MVNRATTSYLTVLRSVEKYPIRFLLQRLVPSKGLRLCPGSGISTGVNSGGTRRTQIPVLQVFRRIHIPVVMCVTQRAIPLTYRERQLEELVAARRTRLTGGQESRRHHQLRAIPEALVFQHTAKFTP